MLKYSLNKQSFDNDTVEIKYSSILTQDYVDIYGNMMIVSLECENLTDVNSGDELQISSEYVYYNDIINVTDIVYDITVNTVYTVDNRSNRLSFLESKYKNLDLDTITADIDNGIIVWTFSFNNPHYFTVNDNPIIYVSLKNGDYMYLDTNVEYVNYSELKWVYDPNIYNADIISDVLFPNISSYTGNSVVGNISDIIVSRTQFRWFSTIDQEHPTVMAYRHKVCLDIPLSFTHNVNLNREGNLNEFFVKDQIKESVNDIIDMEKYVYKPVILTSYSNFKFKDCNKINFNLHFREHSGENWTVENQDTWNFMKYGEYGGIRTANKYYSYGNNVDTSTSDKWNVSCQSDLLGYLGFEQKDVRYQKNTLKKSFIRLSFYDSPIQGSQKLLAYSTIFINSNNLYSKFIRNQKTNCYFDKNGLYSDRIDVYNEVDETRLKQLLEMSNIDNETIENYRLSSQISVENKYSSNNSSEGFYLYLWEDENYYDGDVYMKVDFNHAGFGRNIPMMSPYKEHIIGMANKFKTNEDIKNDWINGNGYDIKTYIKYSYIHFKTKYDETTKQHIYYLDPDTYGLCGDKNILNINLYEAKVTF